MEASVAAKREREKTVLMLILVDWSQLVKLLLNESNQHRILSTGGAGSLEEQRAVYWMYARWGKEMPVKSFATVCFWNSNIFIINEILSG